MNIIFIIFSFKKPNYIIMLISFFWNDEVYATNKQMYNAKEKRTDNCLKQKKKYSIR